MYLKQNICILNVPTRIVHKTNNDKFMQYNGIHGNRMHISNR